MIPNDPYLALAAICLISAGIWVGVILFRQRSSVPVKVPPPPDIMLLEVNSLAGLRSSAADEVLAKTDFQARNLTVIRGQGWTTTGTDRVAQILVVKLKDDGGSALKQATLVVEFEPESVAVKNSRIEADFLPAAA
jgi:hypothetical protein